MIKENFIELFKDCIDDVSRWKLLIENKDIFQEVLIDNDNILVIFDDDNYVDFNNFGYLALLDLLKSLNVKANFV